MQAPFVRYYSLIDEVTLHCDASDMGLGSRRYALLTAGCKLCIDGPYPNQDHIRSISERAPGYCLLVRSLTRQYIFGRDVVHEKTDHKTLEEIFKKSLCDAPVSLQRIFQ